MLTLVFLLLASAIFFLWYKNPNRFPTTAILWTNRPEFAAYAELFNASQELYQIEVVYKNEPAREIEEGKIDTNMQELVPDLVAGAYLNNEKPYSGSPLLHPFLQRRKGMRRGEQTSRFWTDPFSTKTFFRVGKIR